MTVGRGLSSMREFPMDKDCYPRGAWVGGGGGKAFLNLGRYRRGGGGRKRATKKWGQAEEGNVPTTSGKKNIKPGNVGKFLRRQESTPTAVERRRGEENSPRKKKTKEGCRLGGERKNISDCSSEPDPFTEKRDCGKRFPFYNRRGDLFIGNLPHRVGKILLEVSPGA